MLYFQCDIHEYIVGSGGSPIFIPIELIVMCVPNQKYPPIFIDTNSTTDVPQSANTAHISYIIISVIGSHLIGDRVVDIQNIVRVGG